MVKDFDSTLTDALDLAAHSAQTAGPAAARIRGRQRTMRKRIALSTASLVLVAVGATAAFKVASPGHNGAPVLTKPSPSASASATPTPGAAAATGAPSTSASSSPSASTPSSPVTSSTSTSASPFKVATAAWLSPSQMPFGSTFNWTATKTSQNIPGWQSLTPTVYYFPSSDTPQALTVCGDPTSFLSRTIGGQLTSYTATTPPTSAKANNLASQYIFFFTNDKTALSAYMWLQSQYDSACFATFKGAQFTKTASSSTEATWLTLKGTSGSPDLPDYTREYFVLRGSTITYVSVTSYTQTLATTYDDTTQLSVIAGHACVYGGSCQ